MSFLLNFLNKKNSEEEKNEPTPEKRVEDSKEEVFL